MRILITAIGSMSAECAITQLKKNNHYIVGCDIYPGEWHYETTLCDAFYKAPLATDEQKYIDFLIDVCRKESVKFLIPLTDLEIDVINHYRCRFDAMDIILCMQKEEVLNVVRNKYKLYKYFENDTNVPSLTTSLLSELDSGFTFPCVAKPYNGRSSQGLILNASKEQVLAIENKENYILQEQIKGDILTVDYCRSSEFGNDVAIPRIELLRTKNGAGTTIKTISDNNLIQLTSHIGRKLNINGCVNMEFIHNDGKYYLIDINPRFSAGVAFSVLMGYDMISNHLHCYTGHSLDYSIAVREQIVIKKWQEVVNGNELKTCFVRTNDKCINISHFYNSAYVTQTQIDRMTTQTSFYSEEELQRFGFKSIGKGCMISRKASFYGVGKMSIGNNVRIDDFSILTGAITLGNNIHISAYVALYGVEGIVFEDYSGISARSTIYSAMDDFSGDYLIGPIHPEEYTNVTGGKVTVGRFCQIGANCLIFPNLTIGEGCVVGACSMVRRSLEPWGVYFGLPVRRHKERRKSILKYFNFASKDNILQNKIIDSASIAAQTFVDIKQKKLLLLGGIRYLLPVIKAAHEQGYYVITADYLPDNIAHKYSDEYVNVSIIDKEAVLKVAREKQIDGIMSFGVDPGVVSASYVQNEMELPSFGPFESVEILQNKDRFRAYLKENGFNVPWAFAFSSKEDAYESRGKFSYPLIIKPTDSAGSKGCTRVDSEDDLQKAIEYAFRFSISGHIIIEEFLDKQGCSSDTDCYVENGILKYVGFSTQRFDASATNPYTPAAYSWPSTFTKGQEEYLTNEIQRLITLLQMRTCVFNIETRVTTDGKPYIMELTPRGGGNRLCEMIRYATGVDMITAVTRYVVGDEPSIVEQKPYNGHWAEVILHADKSGVFDHLEVNPIVPTEIIEEDLWVAKGDVVESFEGANNAIGTLVLRFENAEDLETAITNQSKWIKVVVR